MGAERESLRKEYPDYFDKHDKQLGNGHSQRTAVRLSRTQAHAATRTSFGFEWTRFSEMRPEWEQNFWGYFAPKTADFFQDKLVLDAGCGMGRHLYYTAKSGADAIGVDFSRAVDAAFQNTREFPNCHVVQADLAHLPFRPETFDLIYSFGVLHHLPNPESVFDRLLRFLKPGGETRIFVYWGGNDAPAWKRALIGSAALLRQFTTRLPHRILFWLCYPIAAAVGVAFVLPYKLLARAEFTRSLAEKLPMKQYARYPFGVLLNDQFDRLSAPLEKRYSRDQVEVWLKQAGLDQVDVTSYFGWLGHGRKRDAHKGLGYS